MSCIEKWPNHFKVAVLTIMVVGSFILSSIGHIRIPSTESNRIIVGAVIMLIMYTLMVFELVNRNLAALIGAVLAIAAHDCLVEYVDMENILVWEDLETLSLLFGMMIIVNVLSYSGLFDYLAIWSYRKSGGRFWTLISVMSIITSTLSAFIDNVSTMLLMSPTLIKLSELEHIDPRYTLMIMVVMSNIGGIATPVGDPPNLIIIGDPICSKVSINFGSFTALCLPGVAIIIVVVLLYLRLFYSSKKSFRHKVTKLDKEKAQTNETQEDYGGRVLAIYTERSQLMEERQLLSSFRLKLDEIGDRASQSSRELKEDLDRQLASFESAIEDIGMKEHSLSLSIGHTKRRGSRLTDSEIDRLMHDHRIKSKPILIQSLSVLTVAVLLFFLQSLPGVSVNLGWISLFAGLSLLVISSSTKLPKKLKNGGKEETISGEEDELFERVISSVEWSTLIFFFALFIVMEVMAKLGLIQFMGQQVSNLINQVPAGPIRSICAICIILWSAGLASACIDNVPFTSMMIKILGTMLDDWSGETDAKGTMRALVIALAFGSCLGGNGTLIGASANLITTGIAGRCGYPITFNQFFKFTAPITFITLVVANIYLIVVFVLLDL